MIVIVIVIVIGLSPLRIGGLENPPSVKSFFAPFVLFVVPSPHS